MTITNLCTVKPDEILRLMKYIEKFAPEDETNKKRFALSHINNFFIDLTLPQEIELYSILERENMFDLNEFIKKYPTLRFNSDGDSKPKTQPAWQIKESALISSYSIVKANEKQTKIEKQIIQARELTNLKNVSEYPYLFEKLKMQEEHLLPRNIDDLEKYENIDKFDVKRFLALAFEYFRKHKNKNTFLEYVFYYLDVVRLDENNESILAKDYIATISELFDYFDKKRMN